MTLKNQNKFSLIIFFLFVAFCVCWNFISTDNLKRNGIVISGRVRNDVFATKSSVMQFEYEFVYNGKSYLNSSLAGVTNSSEFIGKTFPVRFSPESGKSEILITLRHFEKYNLTYPDSLEWVKNYFIKGF